MNREGGLRAVTQVNRWRHVSFRHPAGARSGVSKRLLRGLSGHRRHSFDRPHPTPSRHSHVGSHAAPTWTERVADVLKWPLPRVRFAAED